MVSCSQTVAYCGQSDVQPKNFVFATHIKKLIAEVYSFTLKRKITGIQGKIRNFAWHRTAGERKRKNFNMKKSVTRTPNTQRCENTTSFAENCRKPLASARCHSYRCLATWDKRAGSRISLCRLTSNRFRRACRWSGQCRKLAWTPLAANRGSRSAVVHCWNDLRMKITY